MEGVILLRCDLEASLLEDLSLVGLGFEPRTLGLVLGREESLLELTEKDARLPSSATATGSAQSEAACSNREKSS
jgi:hypothetical protein